VVVVPSEAALERLRELRAPLPWDRVRVIPPPVRPAPDDELARPAGGTYALVVSRLAPEKGVDVAIDAYLDLLRAGPTDVDLAIVGGGRKAGSATEVALAEQAAPAGARVHFLGVQEPDVVAMLYDNAAALVAPSYQEGQPLVVAEAMRAGCCIIASDIPAHLELLGDTARIFACGDADALGGAVDWALRHPGDARALGERAAARIAAGSYSWDEAAAATERVLEPD